MGRTTVTLLLLLGVLAAAGLLLWVLTTAEDPAPEPPEADLLLLMSQAQRFTEKLHYAGTAGNWPLAAYYAHELEEVGEELRDGGFEEGGVDLGEVARDTFLPAVARVDQAIDIGPEAFRERFGELVASCNTCHTATGYGVVRIQVPDEARPYPSQSFTP